MVIHIHTKTPNHTNPTLEGSYTKIMTFSYSNDLSNSTFLSIYAYQRFKKFVMVDTKNVKILSWSHITYITLYKRSMKTLTCFNPFVHNSIHWCFFIIRLWTSVVVIQNKIIESCKNSVLCMWVDFKWRPVTHGVRGGNNFYKILDF